MGLTAFELATNTRTTQSGPKVVEATTRGIVNEAWKPEVDDGTVGVRTLTVAATTTDQPHKRARELSSRQQTRPFLSSLPLVSSG